MENFISLFPDNRAEGETVLRQAQLVMLRNLKIVDYICNKHNIKYWLDGGTLLGAVRHGGFIPWDDDLDISMIREDYNKFIEAAKKELPDDLFLQLTETDPEYDMPWLKIRDNNSEVIEYKSGNYHKGLFIDVFPMDYYGISIEEVNKKKKAYKLRYRLMMLIKEPFEKIISPKIFIKNIVKLICKAVFLTYTLQDKSALFSELRERRDAAIASSRGEEQKVIGYGPEVIFWNNYFNKEDIFPIRKFKFEDGEFNVPNNYHKYLTDMFGNYMELPPEKDRIPHNLSLNPILNKPGEVYYDKNTSYCSQ
ncbi:LicD family protein [Clostridium polynesiense]|uniref:LicD family protein n=1 Tax=Clostridium polynesiense TaxID=1325933 RepID=UPI000693C633|nr:LicD family protein [Clostridium polynesiense]